jgi:hypothetical protein
LLKEVLLLLLLLLLLPLQGHANKIGVEAMLPPYRCSLCNRIAPLTGVRLRYGSCVVG